MALWKRAQAKDPGSPGGPLHCSFCGKSQRHVKKLVAGPKVYICDECVEVCNEVLAGDDGRQDVDATAQDQIAGTPVEAAAGSCSLCRTRFPASTLVLIPERGAICFACAGLVREAVETASAEQ